MQKVDTPRKVGMAVSHARKARGITQGELAQACGASRQLINRLEMGAATGIGLKKLLKVLSYLGLDLYVSGTANAKHVDSPTPGTEPANASNGTYDHALVDELLVRYSLDRTLLDEHNEEA